MHHVATRLITLLVLISVMLFNLGMTGPAPFMAHTGSQASLTSLWQPATTEVPAVTTTEEPTDLPPTLENASNTPSIETGSATPPTKSEQTVTSTITPKPGLMKSLQDASPFTNCSSVTEIPASECDALVAL